MIDYEYKAKTLLKAAKIIRQEILNTTCRFKGEFDVNFQRESVPESLKTLVGMILCAPDIKTQSSNMIETQTTVSISQLTLFNSTKRRRNSETRPSRYHSTTSATSTASVLGSNVTRRDEEAGSSW